MNKHPLIADFGYSCSDIARLCLKKLRISAVFGSLGAEQPFSPVPYNKSGWGPLSSLFIVVLCIPRIRGSFFASPSVFFAVKLYSTARLMFQIFSFYLKWQCGHHCPLIVSDCSILVSVSVSVRPSCKCLRMNFVSHRHHLYYILLHRHSPSAR